MRDFLKDCLKKLKLWTGYAQGEKLTDSELTELLDILQITCDQYALIDDKKKEEIIRYELVHDKDFKGFNAAVLHRWFQRHMASNTMLYAQKSNEGSYDKEKESRNIAFAKKQLELKKANDPDYDPMKEMKKQLLKFKK